MNNLRYLLYKMYLLKQNPGLGFESGFYYRKSILFSAVSFLVEVKRNLFFVFELAGELIRIAGIPASKFAFNATVGIPIFLAFIFCSPMVSAIHFTVSKKANVFSKQQPKPADKYSQYDAYIKKAAAKYRIDPLLVKAIIMAESRYNPKTISKAGACGLMQLMPKTAKLLGVEDIFDPEENIMAGTRFFSIMLDEFGCRLELALAAYNAGPTYLRENNNQIPPYKETKHYIRKVQKYYKQFANNPA